MKQKLVLLIFITGCGDDCRYKAGACYNNHFQNITDYCVEPNVRTPSGIKLDTSGYEVDLERLDTRVNEIESCVLDTMQKYSIISDDEQRKWQCLRNSFDPERDKLKRDCLVIKVVDPIYSCSDWQHIPDDPEGARQICLTEGFMPREECPCYWRTAIQDENVIITPPAIYLWELGRIMTSCNGVWQSPFAACLGHSPEGIYE